MKAVILMSVLYNVQSIKQALAPVFDNYTIRSVVLFGSYAKGTATERSDMDMLVDSGGTLCGLNFFGLAEDIRETLKGVDFDLIEACDLTPDSDLESEIKNTGVVIYGTK